MIAREVARVQAMLLTLQGLALGLGVARVEQQPQVRKGLTEE